MAYEGPVPEPLPINTGLTGLDDFLRQLQVQSNAVLAPPVATLLPSSPMAQSLMNQLARYPGGRKLMGILQRAPQTIVVDYPGRRVNQGWFGHATQGGRNTGTGGDLARYSRQDSVISVTPQPLHGDLARRASTPASASEVQAAHGPVRTLAHELLHSLAFTRHPSGYFPNTAIRDVLNKRMHAEGRIPYKISMGWPGEDAIETIAAYLLRGGPDR